MTEWPFYKTDVRTLAENIVENYERSMVLALILELERKIDDPEFTRRHHNLVAAIGLEQGVAEEF